MAFKVLKKVTKSTKISFNLYEICSQKYKDVKIFKISTIECFLVVVIDGGVVLLK